MMKYVTYFRVAIKAEAEERDFYLSSLTFSLSSASDTSMTH
jgi:hypothetical protein